MEIEIDADVKAVLEFMQANIPTAKLTEVARGVDKLAPLLWEQFERRDSELSLLRLRSVPISPDGLHTRPSSNERHLAS